MKRQPITKNDVFIVADEIVEMGLNPTQRAVMRRIGGSFGTVGAFLDEWRRARRAANENPETTAPDQFLDTARAFVNELWSRSMDLAATRLHENQKQLEHERAALAEERNDTFSLIRDMENAAAAREMRVTALEAALHDAEAVTASQREKLAEASERAAVADMCLALSNARIDELTESLAEANKRNDMLLESLLASRPGRKPRPSRRPSN
jgi:hypothetical protein